MQAIVTKFHGPTNHFPARVSAQCDAATIMIDWPSALGVEDAHTLAAASLARQLGWFGAYYGNFMVRADMPQQSPYAYVFVLPGKHFTPTERAWLDMLDIVYIPDPKWHTEKLP